MVRFSKKSIFGYLRNRSSNLEQRILLKVSSNLEWREYYLCSLFSCTNKLTVSISLGFIVVKGTLQVCITWLHSNGRYT
jgi:hypothetical protein